MPTNKAHRFWDTQPTTSAALLRNQSSDILQHSQNILTGDRWLKL